MSQTSSPVQGWFLHSYIDVFFYSSLEPSVLSVQDLDLVVFKAFSFRCEQTADTGPEELALLCWAMRLFNGFLVSPM